MYKQKEEPAEHYVGLQENSGGGYGDPTKRSSSSSLSAAASFGPHPHHPAPPTNVDRTLYNDLVDLVPLVQTLIDRKAGSSFARRGSMIYTKTPSRDSLLKKSNDSKGRNATKSVPAKKCGDHTEKGRSKSTNNHADAADGFSIFTSANKVAERHSEELMSLRQQIDDLQRKLLEKDELLEAAENSKNQEKIVQAKYNDLTLQIAEKDSLIRSTQQQLHDAKIKLADKQAALEKIQWEVMTSNQTVKKLQDEIDSVQSQMSSFMMVFESLKKADSIAHGEDYDIVPYHIDHVSELDDMNMNNMLEMEDARKAYLVAVASAKEKQDEESLKAAVNARLHLQSFVFRRESDITNNMTSEDGGLRLVEGLAH